MWTIYDIYSGLFWNERDHRWCAMEYATLYSIEERDRVPLQAITHQWRFVSPAACRWPTPSGKGNRRN